MKIGIITYHRAHNYGALLQAYALKAFLNNNGYKNVEFIDYWPQYHSKEYKLLYHFKERSFKGKVKGILFLTIGFSKYIRRKRGFENFMLDFLKLKKDSTYIYREELNTTSYDIVIYGSDQIWRKQNYPLYKGFDEAYFGSLINASKKITYAASMGVIDLKDITDKDFLKIQMRNFDKISVRERELQILLKNTTNKNIQLVLDPVFLLDQNQWRKILPKLNFKYKYILLYQLKPSDDSVRLSNLIAKKFGCKVIEIAGRINPLRISKRYSQTVTPLEFVALIHNAEFIVTTSFHGTAFSILFEKQFYSIGMNDNSDRAKTLLNNLEISDRYLENIDNIDLDQKINYKAVNANLQNNIINSVSFLENALYE